ncbi:hypothetical protein ACXWTF_13020 [Thiomicrolovo sp. ZZH C-3]
MKFNSAKTFLAPFKVADLYDTDAPAQAFMSLLEQYANRSCRLPGGVCRDGCEYLDVFSDMSAVPERVTVQIRDELRNIHVYAANWEETYLVDPVTVSVGEDAQLFDLFSQTANALEAMVVKYMALRNMSVEGMDTFAEIEHAS